MGDPVYRNYDAAALWAQYDNRAQIPAETLDAIKADQAARSEDYRRATRRAYFNVAYDRYVYHRHWRQRLDLFLPTGRGTPPLFVFIHGGYWQWNKKEDFNFLAREFVDAGAAFANVEYALCPSVTLGELTNQCRHAGAFLWRGAEYYGYDRERIVVSGHSAGGHLAAMLQTTDWSKIGGDLPADFVAGCLPISGIYDIEPIRLTPLNDAVRLEQSDVPGLSPMFLKPTSPGPAIAAYGEAEYDEFHRQARDLASAWAGHGTEISVLELPDRNHFTALNALAEPDHDLFRAALGLLGLG